jgi:hypothetical protein
MMLEIGCAPENRESQFRVFPIYLKAAKLCIEANSLEIAAKAIERTAQASLLHFAVKLV